MAFSRVLPSSFPLLLALVGGLFFVAVWYETQRLPEALTESDEYTQPGRFIAERARNTSLLLDNIGNKVVGSQIWLNAKRFLLDEIQNIRAVASATHKIEVDVQTASGNFPLVGMTSVYAGVQNVVVRLSPALVTPAYSLLLNSHYDSVPVSNGGSDDGFMVSVLLEVLRVLATSTATHEHSLVFLFNGAEENGLQGSHPFITQHKWASNVRAFVNLDSAGSGGKDNLFQITTGDSWLMQYYQKVAVHPRSSGLDQELFQMNLIPSDTDYRIFRDFGGVAGVDISTGKNGYVYHTRNDRAEIIPAESFQNVGDNILALAKALANAPELNDPQLYKAEDLVFFDFLGWFMVTYSQSTGVYLNIAVSIACAVLIILSLASFSESSGLSICHVVGDFIVISIVQLVSIALGCIVAYGLSYEYDALHHSMSWFSLTWLPLGIYACPFFFALGFAPAIYLAITQKRASSSAQATIDGNTENQQAQTKSPALSQSIRVQLFMHAQALVLMAILLALTYFGLRSAYIVMVAVIFYTFSTFINWLTRLQTGSDCRWVYVHLIGQLVPFAFYSYTYLDIVPNLIPSEGRSGTASNPEIVIALFTVAIAFLVGGLLVPLFSFVKQPVWMVSLFALVWLVSVGVIFSSIGFPYRSAMSEQRFWIYHTDRTIHQFNDVTPPVRDSGYFMLGMDRNGNDYLEGIVPNISQAVSTSEYCSSYLYCGVPLYTSRQMVQVSASTWLAAGSPLTANLTKLQLLSATNTAVNVKRYQFQLHGSDHMDVFISPLAGSQLVNWTISATPYPYASLFNNRENYFVFFGSGKQSQAAYNFTLDVQTNVALDQPSIEIVSVGHWVHNDQDQTAEFKRFLASFPKWAHVTPWMSSYENWQY